MTEIYGPPDCTFEVFGAHLASHPSPAIGEAKKCWDELVAAGVRPGVALGFFHHESGCGLRGRAVTTKSWGNIRWRRNDATGDEPYTRLSYSVGNVNGFCSYGTYRDGVRHFIDHLLGKDGTNAYAGLTTVEDVVPIWAPVGDRNVPSAYIAAVNAFAESMVAASKGASTMSVLIFQGHVGIQGITNQGACPGRDFTSLRASTGSNGEAAWVGDLAPRLAASLAALGVTSVITDAVYHPEVYARDYDLCINLHFHRDGRGRPDEQRPRAFAAAPNPGYITDEARAKALRWVALFNAEFEPITSIPITPGGVTTNMTENYAWCYVSENTPSVLPELGNADLDAAVMYEAGIARIVRALTAVTVKFLGVTIPVPAPTPPPTPVPPVPTPTPVKQDLLEVARKLTEIANRL